MPTTTAAAIHQRGTLAARPAAAAHRAGILYQTTDETPNKVYYCTGSSWVLYVQDGASGSGTGDVVGPVSSAIGDLVIFDNTSGDLIASAGVNVVGVSGGQVLSHNGSALTWEYPYISLTFVIDGGGSAITGGIKGDLEVPDDYTILQATALADQSGSIVVDIWKDSYTNYPPVDADSITASAPVTITTATKSQDTSLSGWTTSLAAGDILRFNVDSATTVTRVTVALRVRRR